MAKSIQQLPDLAHADWLTSPALKSVFQALGGSDEVRVVGGAVRNFLLGQAVADIDLATTHSAEEIICRAEKAGIKAVATGGQHGTVSLIVKQQGETHVYEVTPLRIDVETDGRRAIVAPTQNWALDAQRRDFYINALYCDETGKIYDFVGGLDDVQAHKVRFIGKADDRIKEDYLRILRFFRFSAFYTKGVLDAEGLAACRAQKDHLTELSAERIKQEMFKLLVAPFAREVIEKMVERRVMEKILPGQIDTENLARLVAVERELALPGCTVLRLAALAGGEGQQMKGWGRQLKLSNKESAALTDMSCHVSAFSSHLVAAAQKALLYRLGAETYKHCAILAWSLEAKSADAPAWKHLIDLANRWPVPVFPLGGADVMALGVAKGPRIGEILSTLEQDWIETGFEADAPKLLELLKTITRQ